MPFRSSERMVEDELCWPSASRAKWKYGRNNKENRGFFRQKEWKGHLRSGNAKHMKRRERKKKRKVRKKTYRRLFGRFVPCRQWRRLG
uniref:Uncharacterized protein n=1 Tax=Nelumbo nucifera TaxID=4432 RepID=A0A822YRA3_NELNU|nr:TPA_asm: hypothetical protein HUJ06_005313 [Nelumbo nucifera]